MGDSWPKISKFFRQFNFGENENFDQYRNPKVFYEKYVGEEFLNFFRSYLDMKNFYLIQVIDLGIQSDLITPKKIQLFEECRNNPAKARVLVIFITQREYEMVPDGSEFSEIEVLWNDTWSKNICGRPKTEKNSWNWFAKSLQVIYLS